MHDKEVMSTMMQAPSREAWLALLEEPLIALKALYISQCKTAILQLLQRQCDEFTSVSAALAKVCCGGRAGESWATPPRNLKFDLTERGIPIIEHGLVWIEKCDAAIYENGVGVAKKALLDVLMC